jgi:hypothetical protein
MSKLQRITPMLDNQEPEELTPQLEGEVETNEEAEDDSQPWEKLPNGSIVVTLRDGLKATFREPKAMDVSKIRNAGCKEEMELTARVGAVCCNQWGDKPGCSHVQILNLGVADFQRISDAINGFLR